MFWTFDYFLTVIIIVNPITFAGKMDAINGTLLFQVIIILEEPWTVLSMGKIVTTYPYCNRTINLIKYLMHDVIQIIASIS